MTISKDREYVLLSVKWTTNSHLVFWGTQTEDNQMRSYSGYTMDLDTCEKYTREESVSKYHPEYNGQTFWELKKECDDGTWAIKIEDLEKLGRKMTIIYL